LRYHTYFVFLVCRFSCYFFSTCRFLFSLPFFVFFLVNYLSISFNITEFLKKDQLVGLIKRCTFFFLGRQRMTLKNFITVEYKNAFLSKKNPILIIFVLLDFNTSNFDSKNYNFGNKNTFTLDFGIRSRTKTSLWLLTLALEANTFPDIFSIKVQKNITTIIQTYFFFLTTLCLAERQQQQKQLKVYILFLDHYIEF